MRGIMNFRLPWLRVQLYPTNNQIEYVCVLSVLMNRGFVTLSCDLLLLNMEIADAGSMQLFPLKQDSQRKQQPTQ